jgi:Protein of unknown function (DUF3485)
MPRVLLILSVAVFVLGEGYLCGRWSGRWDGDQDPQTAEVLSSRLPLRCGDWQGESQQLNPDIVERAGFRGYVLRRYVNQRSGAVVCVLLAWGRSGPLSVHTPEVCYGGAGFGMAAAPTRFAPTVKEGSTPAEFSKTTFTRQDSTSAERLRVLWSWNKGGGWEISDDPRWTFAGTPVLYKMYVAQPFFPRDEAADGADCVEFLRLFLPACNKALARDP